MPSSLAAGIAAAVLLASCGTSVPNNPTPLLDVPGAVANLSKLKGRTVRVVGYLGRCAGYECLLFVNRDDERRFDEYIANLRKMEQYHNFEPPMLGIGSTADFDQQAAPLVPGFVVITGELTDECRDEDGQPGCTDRTTDIKPTGIKAWRSPSVPTRQPDFQKATLN